MNHREGNSQCSLYSAGPLDPKQQRRSMRRLGRRRWKPQTISSIQRCHSSRSVLMAESIRLRNSLRPWPECANDDQCKVPGYEAELQNLEEMAGKLVVAAFNLPPGVARYESLMLIDSFRERITAMKRSGLQAMCPEF